MCVSRISNNSDCDELGRSKHFGKDKDKDKERQRNNKKAVVSPGVFSSSHLTLPIPHQSLALGLPTVTKKEQSPSGPR